MRSGDVSPEDSRTFGPVGTRGSAGSGPRSLGTTAPSMRCPPSSHSNPPSTPFRFCTTSRGRWGAFTEATYRSVPWSVATLKANRWESGAQLTEASDAPWTSGTRSGSASTSRVARSRSPLS